MVKSRENSKTHYSEYNNPARQAIESGPGRYEHSSDKQPSDGLVSVTIEGLNKANDLINQLREDVNSQEFKLNILEKLEKTLDDMVVK